MSDSFRNWFQLSFLQLRDSVRAWARRRRKFSRSVRNLVVQYFLRAASRFLIAAFSLSFHYGTCLCFTTLLDFGIVLDAVL